MGKEGKEAIHHTEKRRRLYILPQYLANLTQPIGTKKVIVLKNSSLYYNSVYARFEVASLADALLARHAIFPPQRTSADPSGEFLSHCSQRLVGEHVQINGEPIGAKLLFSEKPIRTDMFIARILTRKHSESKVHFPHLVVCCDGSTFFPAWISDVLWGGKIA